MPRIPLLSSLLLLASPAFAQFNIGTGDVDQLYQTHCASCHGQQLEGGQGSSLVDDIWKHGSSDVDLTRVIAQGLPDEGMVPWAGTLSSEQIRSLVIYIREQGRLAREHQPTPRPLAHADTYTSELHRFTVERIAEAEGTLWSIAFLPDGDQLLAQREGLLWRHTADGELYLIEGTPEVWDHGQGGLLEVALHPDYATNGWIYLGYSENTGDREKGRVAGMTAIVRGRIVDDQWTDQEELFHVPGKFHTSSGVHFGTRFVFDDGYLYFSIGDRGRQDMAQDPARPNGKIHRIHDDGRIPNDNPFPDNAYPSLWTLGNRNAQGLAQHPVTGELWSTEHGPRGGDEVNVIRRGRNYGWPLITYGMNYNGTPITSETAREGLEQPALHWTPSIAVCGIDFYTGDKFPNWQNQLFAGGLASQELHRLELDGDRVVKDEVILSGIGRVRDVATGPDGHLFLILNHRDTDTSTLVRLIPAEE